MKGKVLTSWSLIWLVVAVLLVAGGALNLSQRASRNLPPTDGVLWTRKAGGIYAEKVIPGLSGARADVAPGDKLLQISLDGNTFDEVASVADVPMYLDAAGTGGTLTYRTEKPYSWANVYIAELRNIDSLPRWTPSIVFLAIVGVFWLGVGFLVLFKQGSRSPFVLHFATLCLVAFVFHVYHSLSLDQDIDAVVGLLDDFAFAFFVPVFLHFCLRYPVRSEVLDAKPWKTYVLYVPALVLSVVSVLVFGLPLLIPNSLATPMNLWIAANGIIPLINQTLLVHFVGGITAGSALLLWRFFTSGQPLVRQRLKWAMVGTVLSVIPIVGVQVARRFVYLPDDTFTVALTTLPLALIPLSFGHSVVRYRLMDVDVVVRRAVVYAMTTILIAMMIGAVALGLVYLAVGSDLSPTEITLRALIAIVAMAAIVMLSEPLKNFLQERVERFFYGTRYDLRSGLLDFGRTLSASTAIEPLLDGLTDRLQQVLDVEKLAVFVEDEKLQGEYRIAKSVALSDHYRIPADFKQMIRQKSAETGIVRADQFELGDGEVTYAPVNGNGNGNGNGHLPVRQELHYYVPCVVRSKMVAVIGLGRAKDGSLLSSEDLEILKTVSGYIGVAIENSSLYQQQKRQTEELSLLKEFNESIVESVNVGLLAVDENGRITRCNTTFEEMMGLPREAITGKLFEEVFDEAFAYNLGNILGKSKWHLTEIRNAYKMHAIDAQGKPLMLNVAVAPLRSVSNSQSGAIVVLENVSSRVKLEETLQQSEKLSSIGLLAAGVAHEVNTPLTGVSSYTQMLLGMVPETDPKHALLQKMQRQTDRATNIVSNLLNFSRIGSVTDSTDVSINRLLDDTLQLLEPQIRKSNIEIVKNYSDDLEPIFGNAGKLQQVFTNLILNARDAMIAGGKITLRTDLVDDDEIKVEVTDTGAGIAPENLGKIFDPFFTTKGVGNGTGLGLAVTYGIVQEHGGTIEAFSESGNGTTFMLSFPVASKVRKRAAS